jgi:hypothetical protein
LQKQVQSFLKERHAAYRCEALIGPFKKILTVGIKPVAASIPDINRLGTLPGAGSCFEAQNFD